MYPREPKKTPENMPNSSSEAPKNPRFAEAKKRFEGLGQPQGPEPQQRAPRPQPSSTASPKKESPYGYFQPRSLKPQSTAMTSLKPGDATLRIPKGEAETMKAETRFNAPRETKPQTAQVDRGGDNNNVKRESAQTVSTKPKLDTSRLSGEYGNPKLRAKEIEIETPSQTTANVRVKRELASNEHIATGKFIVASPSRYIQKNDETDHLIHYNPANLTSAQKDAIAKSMGANFRKPHEGGPTYAMSVSTENKRLVIKPVHH